MNLKKQLAAVQKYGHAIQWIKNPSIEVQLAAVQRNSQVIQHIKNHQQRRKSLRLCAVAELNLYKTETFHRS